MAVGMDVDFARRMLEVLERSRMPTGEGASVGSPGPAPADQVRRFRELMQAPEAVSVGAANHSSGVDPSRYASDVQALNPTDSTTNPQAVEKASFDAPVEKTQAGVELGLMHPEALYALEFGLKMHMFETKAFHSVKNRVSADLEQVLRNNS